MAQNIVKYEFYEISATCRITCSQSCWFDADSSDVNCYSHIFSGKLQDYLQLVIERIKDKIIRYLPQLQDVTLHVSCFDKDNTNHCRLETIIATLHSLSGCTKEDYFTKSLVVHVYYQDKMIASLIISFQNYV